MNALPTAPRATMPPRRVWFAMAAPKTGLLPAAASKGPSGRKRKVEVHVHAAEGVHVAEAHGICAHDLPRVALVERQHGRAALRDECSVLGVRPQCEAPRAGQLLATALAPRGLARREATRFPRLVYELRNGSHGLGLRPPARRRGSLSDRRQAQQRCRGFGAGRLRE